MSKKLFLLESDNNLNAQLISYLKKFFDVDLENFDSAENLFKASVSQQPEVILFGIDSNSKKLFPKLASFKNSFNTKLIAIISQKEKGYIQSIEITHHILYKPFSFWEIIAMSLVLKLFLKEASLGKSFLELESIPKRITSGC